MAPDGRDAGSDSPNVVAIEVTAPSRARPPRAGGSAARRRAIAGLVLGVVIAASAVIWLVGRQAQDRDPVTARGADGVAAAYGYPLGCMSVTIPVADRTYARADLSHAAGCASNTGYAPAIFHYVAGRWRLVPDAIGYTCNPTAVPAVVERAFELCVGNIRQKLPKISGVV
jgi:hypothetical protein